jgi:hypothetical protein
VGESQFYFVAGFRLYGAPLAGGAAQELSFIQGTPLRHLALNSTHVFAVQSGFNVWSIPLAGGNGNVIYSFDGVHPHYDLAADDAALFVIKPSSLVSVPLPAGPPITLVSGVLGRRLGLDATDLYFVQDDAISRIAKAGGAPLQLVALDPAQSVESIAVDDTHVYWADTSSDTVERAPKNGGPAEILASGLADPGVVRLDATSVYWATRGDGAIWTQAK